MTLSRSGKSGITVNSAPKKPRSIIDASGLPSIVNNLSASSTGNTTASVTWSAPSITGDGGITSYTVSGGGSASVTGTTASITGLSANTSYTFTVRANNAVGNGPTASAAAVTTTNWNEATGGTISTVTNYNGSGETWKVHQFTSNGTFTVTNAPNTFRTLVVAAGGWGSYSINAAEGDGGAGGMLSSSATTLSTSPGSYSITVGALSGNNNGGNSSGFGNTATGGGRGGRRHEPSSSWAPSPGGSGGGGSRGWGESGSGTPGQGFPGGPGIPLDNQGHGGGGGAGGAGGWYTGGAGLSNNITGSAYTYSAGGNDSGQTTYGAGVGHQSNGGGQGIVIVSYRVG